MKTMILKIITKEISENSATQTILRESENLEVLKEHGINYAKKTGAKDPSWVNNSTPVMGTLKNLKDQRIRYTLNISEYKSLEIIYKDDF